MSSKLHLVFSIVICLFLASLISRNGSIALLAIPFLIYISAGLMAAPKEIRLQAQREIEPIQNYENEPIRMLLTIENKGSALYRVQISEPVSAKVQILEGAPNQRISIPSNNTAEVRYSFQAVRGRYIWDTTHLTVSDPFGLFEKSVELESKAHACVLPRPVVLPRLRYKPLPNIRTAGSNLSKLPGYGTDFWGIREYHPGDSLHSIQWYKAARYPGMIYSKILEGEEIADIGLLLDARAAANQWFGHQEVFENSIQAASSLAKYYLSAGNRVSLLILNDRLVRVFPGYGKHQYHRIQEELAAATLGERVTLDTLNYLPAKLFPNRSVILLISPLIPGDFETINRWTAEKYQILCVSPNPFDRQATDEPADHSLSFAIRTALLERAVLQHRLRRCGVQMMDWKKGQSLTDAVQSVPLIRK